MTYSIGEIKNMLEPVFLEHNVKKAILFGSYSKGCETEDSDIDLLVDSGLHGLAFYGLLNDIVETLNKEIDMFDYRQFNTTSPLFKEIQEKGVIIYER